MENKMNFKWNNFSEVKPQPPYEDEYLVWVNDHGRQYWMTADYNCISHQFVDFPEGKPYSHITHWAKVENPEPMPKADSIDDLLTQAKEVRYSTVDKIHNRLYQIKVNIESWKKLNDQIRQAKTLGIDTRSFYDNRGEMRPGDLICEENYYVYRNPYYKDWTDDKYIYVDRIGNVYRSDYGRKYGVELGFSDTFQILPAGIDHESLNLQNLKLLDGIIGQFDKYKAKVEQEIQRQINNKKGG